MGGGRQSSSSQSQNKTYAQMRWLSQALSQYGPSLGQGENIFPGSTVAPFSEGQQSTLNNIGNLGDVFSGLGTSDLFNTTQGALSGLLTGEMGAQPISQDQASEYFNTAVRDPAYYNFREGIAPLIEEQYAGPGYFGGNRAHAVTKAGTEMANWLGQQRAELGWNVEQNNRQAQEAQANRALGAVQPALAFEQLPGAIAQQGLQGLGGVFEFQQAEQQQRQSELNAEIERFAAENRITNEEDLAILMSLLGMNFGTSSGSSSGWNISVV